MDFVVILHTLFHFSLLLASWLLFKYYCCYRSLYFASGLRSLLLSTNILSIPCSYHSAINSDKPPPILIVHFL
jgi:hypothetical protein